LITILGAIQGASQSQPCGPMFESCDPCNAIGEPCPAHGFSCCDTQSFVNCDPSGLWYHDECFQGQHCSGNACVND